MPQLNAGFVCLSEVKGLIEYPVKGLVTIAKGDALQDDTAGFAQLGTDNNLTSHKFLGIAAEAVNNSTGGDGDKDVRIIPPLRSYRFYVPNEDATAAADTDRGEIVDLASEDGVDVTDQPSTGWGFWIDKVDTANDHVYGYFRLAG